MSETRTDRPAWQPPANLLFNLLVTILTPMFLAAAEGDLTFARLAAAETLNAYRTETQSDLITIAKIIALGLAVLAAISLSMTDDLPIATVLRLHASANASDRSEHRNRLVLKQAREEHPAPQPAEPEIDYAAWTAKVAATQQRAAENLAQFEQPASAPPAPTQSGNEKHRQATWAASTAAIAAETAASLAGLSPEERHTAELWVEVLNDVSNSFLTEGISPRRKPGDLGALMRGA